MFGIQFLENKHARCLIRKFLSGCVVGFAYLTPRWGALAYLGDLFSALGVIVLALVSFWPPMQFAHIANFAIGLWLIAFGFLASPYPTPPGLQNDIVVGLLLLMLSIIPNHASRPPRPWHDFLARRF
jgi:hypothetical protein